MVADHGGPGRRIGGEIFGTDRIEARKIGLGQGFRAGVQHAAGLILDTACGHHHAVLDGYLPGKTDRIARR